MTPLQRKEYDRKMKIGELREQYQELRICEVQENTMKMYDRYMRVQGIMKKIIATAAENPVRQRQELKQVLRAHEAEKNLLNRAQSVRSMDSRNSLVDQVKGDLTFLDKQIKKITIGDPKEKLRMKEAKLKMMLESKGLDSTQLRG